MGEEKKILVRAGLVAKEGCAERLLEIFAPVIERTRKEEGCLEYSLERDAFDADRFFFFELYKNADAFDEHRKAPYMAAMRPLRDALVKEYLGVSVFEVETDHVR